MSAHRRATHPDTYMLDGIWPSGLARATTDGTASCLQIKFIRRRDVPNAKNKTEFQKWNWVPSLE